MAEVCPTVTARDAHDYQTQINRIAGFAKRIHLDFTDGVFAGTPLVALEQAWWPEGLVVDLHLMVKDPLSYWDEIMKLKLKPHMVIVHAEAEGKFNKLADDLHKQGIKVGVALLPRTSTHVIKPSLSIIDHVLIFSGDLGKFGGTADTQLLSKVSQLKEWKENIEFGWDGGINDQNVEELVAGGIDVLNVGGFVQGAADPKAAYEKLRELIA